MYFNFQFVLFGLNIFIDNQNSKGQRETFPRNSFGDDDFSHYSLDNPNYSPLTHSTDSNSETLKEHKKNVTSSNALVSSGEPTAKKYGQSITFETMVIKSVGPVLISIIVSVVFSFGILFMFRYAIKEIIWGIHIGLIVTFFLISIGFIISGSLVLGGMFAIIGIIDALLVYLFRNRIKLTIQIFKETSKALNDLILLLFEPILTFVMMIFGFMLFAIYTWIIIDLKPPANPRNDDSFMLFQDVSLYFNIFVFYWFLNFIYGCQHFVTASSIAQWYFAHDKKKLQKPVKRAFSHLWKFHIGSICFGSILITIVEVIRSLLRTNVICRNYNCFLYVN